MLLVGRTLTKPFVKPMFAAGNIFHATPMQAFLGKGVSYHLPAVKLYPHEYCTCAPKETCCHIIVVKLSLGMPQTHNKPKPPHSLFMVVKVETPPQSQNTTTRCIDFAAATQTIANLVTSDASAQNPGQQIFTLDSFFEALTVAKESIISPL